MGYLIYYTCNLLVNIVLLSFYVILVFSDHHACTTSHGRNITTSFEFAFKLGLGVLLIDAANTNLVNIYLRLTVQTNLAKYEKMLQDPGVPLALRMYSMSSAIEWVMRIATCGVSLLQFLINHDNMASQCVKKPDGVLVKESHWLTALIVMQMLKVSVFSYWSMKLLEPDWHRSKESRQKDERPSNASSEIMLPKSLPQGSSAYRQKHELNYSEAAADEYRVIKDT